MQYGGDSFNPAGLNQYLLTLAKTPYREDKELKKEENTSRIESEKIAMIAVLQQIALQRKNSQDSQVLQQILQIMANREPAITPDTIRDLELSLDLPLVDCIDAEDKTPLMHAANIQSVGYVQTLLLPEFAASVHLRDKQNRTALHIAVQTVNNPVVSFLLEANSPLDGMDNTGFTPLMKVVDNNDIGTLYLFLEESAPDVNVINPYGKTALRIAIEKGSLAAARLLLKHGATVTSLDLKALFDLDDNFKSKKLSSPDILDRVQIAALLLSNQLQLTSPQLFLNLLEELKPNVLLDKLPHTAWYFCKAEAMRQTGSLKDDEKVMMLSLYQEACDREPFIPAAARHLGNFASQQNNRLEAINYFIQALIGRKQPGLFKFLQSLVSTKTNSEQKQIQQQPKEMPMVDDDYSDPLTWQQLIKQICFLETQLKVETKPETKLETKQTQNDFDLAPILKSIVHHLFCQLPFSILKSLNGLDVQEWEYLLDVICTQITYFDQKNDCGRLVMQVARRCYETIPDAPKDKLLRIFSVLEKIDEFFPLPLQPNATNLDQLTALSLDEDDYTETKHATLAVSNKAKDALLLDGIKLLLKHANPEQKIKIWEAIKNKLPKNDVPSEVKTNDVPQTKLADIAIADQEEAFLNLFRLIPQKERAQFIKKLLFDHFKQIYQITEHSKLVHFDNLSKLNVFSAPVCRRCIAEFPPSPKEQFQKKARSYLFFYKETLALAPSDEKNVLPELAAVPGKSIGEVLVDNVVNTILAEIEANRIRKQKKKAEIQTALTKEPTELIAFMELIEPHDKDAAKQADPRQSSINLPQGILSKFPNKTLTQIIFLLLTTTPIAEKEENAEEQRKLLSPFIPAASVDNYDLPILAASKFILSAAVRKQLHAQLVNFPNVDCLDKRGQTPLMYAVANGAVGFTSVLLEAKASVHLKDRKGRSVLSFAFLNPGNPVIAMLLEKNANPNDIDPEGYSPLIRAARHNDVNAVILLLEKNANPNFQDKMGNTALHHAAFGGYIEIVDLLQKAKTPVNHKNKEGNTALILAALKGHKTIVELLLKNNAQVNTVNNNGFTALHESVRNEHEEISELLLKARANPNGKGLNLLCVVFQYKINEREINYTEEKFNNNEFINNCRILARKLKLAAFLLNFNIPVIDPKKLHHLLVAMENLFGQKIHIDEKYFWEYCMAETLRLQKTDDKARAVFKHYQNSFPFPLKDRRVGELALQNKEYKEAFEHFSRARTNDDPICAYSFVRLGFALQRISSHSAEKEHALALEATLVLEEKEPANNTSSHECDSTAKERNLTVLTSLQKQVEDVFLTFTFQEVSDAFVLNFEQWDYLLNTLSAQIKNGAKIKDIRVMLHAAQKSYTNLPVQEKDNLKNLLDLWNEIQTITTPQKEQKELKAQDIHATKLVAPISNPADIEITLQKAILILFEKLSQDETEIIWQKLNQTKQKPAESKRTMVFASMRISEISLPVSVKPLNQIPQDAREAEFIKAFNEIALNQCIDLIKNTIFAACINFCMRLDKKFNQPEQTLRLFKNILEFGLYQGCTDNSQIALRNQAINTWLHKIFRLFPQTKREGYQETIREVIQLFRAEPVVDQNYTQTITKQFHELFEFEQIPPEMSDPTRLLTYEEALVNCFTDLGLTTQLTLLQYQDGDNLLTRAVRTGNETQLKNLLQCGFDINLANSKGQTALYVAVSLKKHSCVRLLLAKNADPNKATTEKNTPLILATYTGDDVSVKLLLEEKVAIDSQNNERQTALHIAVLQNKHDFIKLLLAKGADPNQSKGLLLQIAAARNDLAILKLLLDAKANINQQDDSGYSALVHATTKGHLECVQFLIQQNANVELTDKYGATALIRAARSKNYAIAEALICAGKAKVNHLPKDNNGVLQRVFEQKLSPPQQGLTTYTESNFNKKEFAESKDAVATIKCAALFINFGAQIHSPDKLIEVLKALPENIKAMPEWAYCIAKALHQKCNDKAEDKSHGEIEKYYSTAGVFPPALRGLGELAFQQQKYNLAANFFIRANAHGDLLAIGCIARLALKMKSIASVPASPARPTQNIITVPFWKKSMPTETVDMLPSLEKKLVFISVQQMQLYSLTTDELNYVATLICKNTNPHEDSLSRMHSVRFALEQCMTANKNYPENAQHREFCLKVNNYVKNRFIFLSTEWNPPSEDLQDRIDRILVASIITLYCLGTETPSTEQELTKVGLRV